MNNVAQCHVHLWSPTLVLRRNNTDNNNNTSSKNNTSTNNGSIHSSSNNSSINNQSNTVILGNSVAHKAILDQCTAIRFVEPRPCSERSGTHARLQPNRSVSLGCRTLGMACRSAPCHNLLVFFLSVFSFSCSCSSAMLLKPPVWRCESKSQLIPS